MQMPGRGSLHFHGELGDIGMVPEVPPIVSNVPGSFAWHVFRERHPALVGQIRMAHPFAPGQLQSLDRLLRESVDGMIEPLPDEAHDKAAWDAWGQSHFGQPWLDAPFLWAESYFYRRLLQSVAYFDSGPWSGIDPFEFLKAAELTRSELEADLQTLGKLNDLSQREKTHALLQASLWGNRADLGFRIGVAAVAGDLGSSAHLVVDDSAAALSALENAGGEVLVIADNAGRELLSDLVLIDHLLQAKLAQRISLHLKPNPYYVSDATTADLVGCLRRLAAVPGASADISGRLQCAFAEGRIRISTHWFYCAPFSFHKMPPDLADEVASASLCILKGDLNYRRLVGVCTEPATTEFYTTASYFPTSVVALRT